MKQAASDLLQHWTFCGTVPLFNAIEQPAMVQPLLGGDGHGTERHSVCVTGPGCGWQHQLSLPWAPEWWNPLLLLILGLNAGPLGKTLNTLQLSNNHVSLEEVITAQASP